MSEATPRPWHYGVTEQGYFGEGLIGPRGQTVFANTGRGMSDASEADANLIVCAVNNHDALLEACKALRDRIEDLQGTDEYGIEDKETWEKGCAAIAAAEASE